MSSDLFRPAEFAVFRQRGELLRSLNAATFTAQRDSMRILRCHILALTVAVLRDSVKSMETENSAALTDSPEYARYAEQWQRLLVNYRANYQNALAQYNQRSFDWFRYREWLIPWLEEGAKYQVRSN